jgi:hypothetical protein
MLCVELFYYQCRIEWKGYEGMAFSLTTGTATVLRRSHSSVAEESSLKADLHIACRAHAVPLPCRALIHTCHAAPLPCSDSTVSFVKVRVVAGNIRTASPTV